MKLGCVLSETPCNTNYIYRFTIGPIKILPTGRVKKVKTFDALWNKKYLADIQTKMLIYQ